MTTASDQTSLSLLARWRRRLSYVFIEVAECLLPTRDRYPAPLAAPPGMIVHGWFEGNGTLRVGAHLRYWLGLREDGQVIFLRGADGVIRVMPRSEYRRLFSLPGD
jgi:hypothetical protein